METVNQFDELRNVWMLSYAAYPPNGGNVCFVYPRFALGASGIKRISPDVFPANGSLGVRIFEKSGSYYSSSSSSVRMCSEFGNVVAVRFKGSEDDLANQMADASCRYFGTFDRNLGTASPIEVRKPADARSDVYQVISLAEPLDPQRPTTEVAFQSDCQTTLYTSSVVVEQEQGENILYFGPFTATPNVDGTLKLQANSTYGLYVSCLDASEAPDVLRVFDQYGIDQPVARFIDGRPFSPRVAQNRIDWMDDKTLVSRVVDNLRLIKTLASNNVAELKNALPRASLTGVDDQRKERMVRLLGRTDYWSELGDFLAEMLKRPDMEQHVVDLALSDRFFGRFKDRLVNTEAIRQEKAREEAVLNLGLNETRRALENARGELEEVERQREAIGRELENTRRQALAEAEAELAGIEERIEAGKAELAVIETDLASADERRDEARTRLDTMLSDREELAAGLLRDTVLISALEQLSGTSRTKDANSPGAGSAAGLALATRPAGELEPRQIAREVYDVFVDRTNRDLDFYEFTNILICLVQAPLTVLSGLPGTGKTSLVHALAGSLGLAPTGGTRRFIEVGVERGWTSHRDWIGYHNPITNTFEKSSPLVFDALTGLSQESPDGVSAPFLMLLDEMNLSPVEYYWTPFLRAYDTYNVTGASVDLGGSLQRHVPPHVRFMATVNSDHTTEDLSPRLIDRAWVLRVEPRGLALDDLANTAPNFDGVAPFAWSDLVRAFGVQERALVDDTAYSLLQPVLTTFATYGMPVSLRSQNMAANYLAAGSRFIDETDYEGKVLLVDHAVAQKILPQISAPASPAVEGLFTQLEQRCSLFPLSTRILDHMRQTGEDHGFYSYFS